MIPAATVIVFRRAAAGKPPEFLMIQRAANMRFAGGAIVFPGGRIDQADRILAARVMPGAEPEEAAGRIAAIRETLEETGLLIGMRSRIGPEDAAAARALLFEQGTLAPVLEHCGLEIDAESLPLFSHWCPLREKSFDTRFYLHDVGTGAVDLMADQTESVGLFWISAQEALQRAASGDVSALFPTLRNLERLAGFAHYEDALANIARYPVQRIHPQVVTEQEQDWVTIAPEQGYPVLRDLVALARRK